VAKISKEEWEKRIKEAGAGRYEFIRWAVDGDFGGLKKCVVRCIKDKFEWESIANNLVFHSKGCPQCSGVRRWTAYERVEQINSLENINFISWVGKYKNNESRANIRCSIDGHEWESRVSNLINGRGCPICKRIKSGNARRAGIDLVIRKIKALENIEFISFVDLYTNYFSRVKVRCKLDGFEWTPSVHNLVNHRRGCPKCARYGFKLDKKGYLYALRSECGMYVKVGISNDPKRRHKQLEKRTPFKFNLVEQVSGDGVKISELEKYFHGKYERAGFNGFDGATEWLNCTGDLLDDLRSIGLVMTAMW